MNRRSLIFRTIDGAAIRLGRIFRGTLMGLAVGILVGSLGHPAMAAVIEVEDACDVLVTGPGEGGNVEASEGDTILLTGDTVHECEPTFDSNGVLLTGNGITIAADWVTLDLNGRSLRSTEDIAAAGEALGLDVENAGVSIGGKHVMVTNKSNATSLVDNFTANFDIKSEDSELSGMQVDGTYNLVGGDAHGGAALAIDKSKNLRIRNIMLKDTTGDNGIDLKRSQNIEIKQGHIEGILAGVRVKDTKNLILTNNYISGHDGTGIEIGRRVQGSSSNPVRISGNIIENNAFNGVSVATGSKYIAITGNTIQNNGECGIEITRPVQNVTTSSNDFANNAGGNICP